jgi:hypothetical protein
VPRPSAPLVQLAALAVSLAAARPAGAQQPDAPTGQGTGEPAPGEPGAGATTPAPQPGEPGQPGQPAQTPFPGSSGPPAGSAPAQTTTAPDAATTTDSLEPLDAIDPLTGQDELPAGKWGFVAALRQNIGELGQKYGFGWLLGVEAGYQPTRHGQTLSLGLEWSALFGRFYASQVGLPDDPLMVVELSMGACARIAMGEETPRFLVVSAGATMLRTSVPVPPDEDRLYIGGYAGFGVEQYVGNALFGLDARFGLLGSGPIGLTLVASISIGSR